MANEAPKLDLGWCVSGFDARNASLTGTTLGGPSGSGQFTYVKLSTSANLTIAQCTVSGMKGLGILQNKPSTGIAADVAFTGVSKAVSGSTAIGSGMELQVDTDGQLIPFSSAAGSYAIGRSLEAAAAVGQIFSALIYGNGGGGLA